MKSKLDFAALSIFIIVSIALAWLAFSFGGMDFNVYYAAARVTLHGGNPYDYKQLAPQIISSAGRLNNPYYYAPWFTWSVVPFALFPYNVARVLWALTHFILWIFSLFNLSKLMGYPPAGWTKWGMWLLVTFVFAWSTWGAEQVGVLIFFLFTLILLAAQRENWTAMGIFLVLVLFKPNITAVPVGMIALWILISKKEWQPILVMIGTLTIFLSLSLLITPKWYLALFQADKIQGLSYTLDSSGGMEIKRYTTTLRDFLAMYGVSGGAFITIYVIVILLGVAAVAFGMYSSASLLEFASLAILINFLVIPYALFYDYPSLTIPLFYGNHLLLKNKWIRYTVNALVVACLFIGGIIPYRYWIAIIIAIFLAIGSYYSRIATSSER